MVRKDTARLLPISRTVKVHDGSECTFCEDTHVMFTYGSEQICAPANGIISYICKYGRFYESELCSDLRAP